MSANRASRRPVAFALVDPTAWARAGWMGMTYAVDTGVPTLALVFQDAPRAAELFARWRRVLGDDDLEDVIRIAIIEGPLPGAAPGYMVHIGVDAAVTGAPEAEVWRRMPNPDDPRLAAFKTALAATGRYRVTPATFGGSRIDILWTHALGKRRLALRRVSDVGIIGDPDAGLWDR